MLVIDKSCFLEDTFFSYFLVIYKFLSKIRNFCDEMINCINLEKIIKRHYQFRQQYKTGKIDEEEKRQMNFFWNRCLQRKNLVPLTFFIINLFSPHKNEVIPTIYSIIGKFFFSFFLSFFSEETKFYNLLKSMIFLEKNDKKKKLMEHEKHDVKLV